MTTPRRSDSLFDILARSHPELGRPPAPTASRHPAAVADGSRGRRVLLLLGAWFVLVDLLLVGLLAAGGLAAGTGPDNAPAPPAAAGPSAPAG